MCDACTRIKRNLCIAVQEVTSFSCLTKNANFLQEVYIDVMKNTILKKPIIVLYFFVIITKVRGLIMVNNNNINNNNNMYFLFQTVLHQ